MVSAPPRMRLYSLFAKVPYLQHFSDRILLIAFIGTHVPLIALILYVSGHSLGAHDSFGNHGLAALLIVLVATLIGTTITLAALRAYTEPVHAAIYALAQYNQQRQLPHLPVDHEDELGHLLSQVQRTLTALDRVLDETRELSFRDELTQLYNRRFFGHRAPEVLAEAQQHNHALSIILGDIDHFKQINDKFSHNTGDVVLQRIAGLLNEATRSGDLVVRFGGEEFLIVLPKTKLKQAQNLAERLRRIIEAYDWAAIHPELSATISVGVASNTPGADLEAIVAAADQRLYQAKAAGRNRVQ